MDFKLEKLTCPIPVEDNSRILLAHGSGGTHMHKLLDKIILPHLMQNELRAAHDSAVLNIGNTKLAFTTDSYVVNPIFFPGGNIGSLSVYGTVNDLAMSGAKPLYISVAFILEEGFALNDLQKILQAIRDAANMVNVEVVTGDTKVVERGKGHGIYINTAGIGLIEHNSIICPTQVQVGDAVIVSGDVGKHGIAIMAKREGLEFETTVESDSAPVSSIVEQLLANAIEIHCLRDITRGGLATTLNEIAIGSKTHIKLQEIAIPVQEEVRNACDLLGLDVLHIACEGRFVAFVAEKDASRALEIMRSCVHGHASQIIGVIAQDPSFQGVTMTNCLGVSRIVDKLNGEQLPRIC
jgi:hydrogenase expression/formation protein HypE